MSEQLSVLVVGATGSVGRHVVAEAVRQGHTVRALVRNQARASRLDPAAELVVGDLTRAETLIEATIGIDAVVFTQGAAYGSSDAEAVDYGAVRNILQVLDGRSVRIALMTSIGHGPGNHARLEASQRTAGPRQRQPVHDRPAGLV
jgi:uncharacterized protein YbjT (DUF2867 family)